MCHKVILVCCFCHGRFTLSPYGISVDIFQNGVLNMFFMPITHPRVLFNKENVASYVSGDKLAGLGEGLCKQYDTERWK